uniref:Uncharacterized protein n=1 Tax=Anopheles dirus TaxID=7168 RepID=A0A182NB44_9DIPT
MSAEAQRQQKLDKVLRDIALKNVQLRRLANLLLVDAEFLRLCDTFGAVQCAVQQASDEELDRFSIDSGTENLLGLLEQQARILQRLRKGCLQRITNYNDTRKAETSELQLRTFEERLEIALKQLNRAHKHFRRGILTNSCHLGDIYQLAEIETLLEQTDFLHGIVCKNHQNCLKILRSTNLDRTIELSCVRLRFAANCFLLLAFVQICELLEAMDSEESIRTLHAKLQREIRASLNEIQVNEEELAALRQKLFASEDSLTAQHAIALEEREKHGLDVQEQLRTINLLEVDRQEIEGRVTRLIEEREAIQKQLDERRQLLLDGMHEIVRLERLIEQIELEISERTVKFQLDAERLEQRRVDILNDESLSPEERSRLLAECDAKQLQLRQSHASSISQLEARCDELKRLSRSLAVDVETFRDEVAQKHRDQLEELERQKLAASSPSKLALIEAQILQQQTEFNENLTMLDRAQRRIEYFTDEHGRYYLNEAGERIYKRDSNASEYRCGPNGEWIKISSAVSLHEDDKGVYFLDKFGQKIYQRQHFTDPQGEYYLDEKGARVYTKTTARQSANGSSESFVTVFQRHTPASEHLASSSALSLAADETMEEESESMQELRERVTNDVAYIQDALGDALRKGLAAVARARPSDPIGYLADYLMLYKRNGLEAQYRQQLLERLRLEESDTANRV